MKNVLKVTILICILVFSFISFSYGTVIDNVDFPQVTEVSAFTKEELANAFPYLYVIKDNGDIQDTLVGVMNNTSPVYGAYKYQNTTYAFYCLSESDFSTKKTSVRHTENGDFINSPSSFGTPTLVSGYYIYKTGLSLSSNELPYSNIPVFDNETDMLDTLRYFIDNPPAPTPSYTKNANVDEFIANTMISMGIKFDTPADALSYAANAWDWCIDETNMETANPFDEWDIESFVSYCNAQSNNYLNWYNGYKVNKDVTNALGEYIRQNIRLLTGLPAGVTSVTGAYLPIYHYGSGFQSGISSPTAQTFYAAQTITYFNGEYVNETDDISTSQFLYTPADVRRFLGYPRSSPVITPTSPTGTGTITNDPNNPDQKNISINFPSLDWLADAIKSILDFLRDAFTTLANILTQLLDAILGLFSDAFESLQDFGQGIIDFIQSVFSGLSDLLSGYVPSDISVIIVTFIALNFGIGLITFVLKGH